MLRKRMSVLLMGLLMMMMSASPALAVTHGGCKAFGHQISTYAHQHRMGAIARGYATGADSYPGKMHIFILNEKEFYCHVFPG